jgi:hypothetical protein
VYYLFCREASVSYMLGKGTPTDAFRLEVYKYYTVDKVCFNLSKKEDSLSYHSRNYIADLSFNPPLIFAFNT